MKDIHSVALLGAGAVGAYFLSGLYEKNDIDFCLIADGERAVRLKKEGVTINGRQYSPEVKTAKEAAPVDLLLIATKYNGLRDALTDVKTLTGPDTTVVSLLNGIDSEELLGTVIDPAQVPYAFMRISSERDGSEVRFAPEKTPGLFIGEKGVKEESERLLAIRRLFEGTPVRYNFCEDILAEQWSKFALNLAYNLPQALLNVGHAAYFDSEHVGFLRDALESETRAVANTYGITFGPLPNSRASWSERARFSTLQDLDARRHTEIDMFCGVLMQKAAEQGVSVPCAEFTYHAIRALEEKNDGLFDYKE